MEENLYALRHWVTESTRNARISANMTIEQQIQRLLNSQSPLAEEIVLFRGQSATSPIIIPRSWFATSDDEARVREQHISIGADCCLFKIHVQPGIKVLDVNNLIGNTNYDEHEVIVDGGGVFYTSKDGFEQGFIDRGLVRGVRMFESWYSPSRQNEINENELFNTFAPNNYEFINSVNNVRTLAGLPKSKYATNKTYNSVWRKIKSKKATRKQRRHKK